MSTTGKGYTISSADSNVRYYQPNTIVIQEDIPDDGFIYILEKGTLGIFKGGSQVSEIGEPGVIFGEMASILHTHRTATVKTFTECQVAVYPSDLLQRVVEQLPPVARKIITAVMKRLQCQTTFHTEDLIRVENLEKMNRQLRKQVVELTRQLETLKAAQAVPAAPSKKLGGMFRNSSK